MARIPAARNARTARRPLVLCVGFGVFLFLVLEAYAQKKHPPAQPIDVNAATIQDLQQLPGIGPTIAKAIVRFRAKSGPFRRVEDLLAVRGISEDKLKKLRPYITVSPPAGKAP
jgi:competence ComEA-like helix-hairpin-helix protein